MLLSMEVIIIESRIKKTTKNTVLKEIKYLRKMQEFVVDTRNSNRYQIITREHDGYDPTKTFVKEKCIVIKKNDEDTCCCNETCFSTYMDILTERNHIVLPLPVTANICHKRLTFAIVS